MSTKPIAEPKFHVNDVVTAHCEDPSCACMDHYPPAIVVSFDPSLAGNDYHYRIKFPFYADPPLQWPERAMKLLHRGD